MAELDEVLVGNEDLDYEVDMDEEMEKARLAKAAKQEEDENDSIDLGVEQVSEKNDEVKTEEVVQIQPKHPEVSHIQPKHPPGSVHSRLGPRNTPSEQHDYEQEEIKDGQEESQENAGQESQENVCSEEFEGDEEEDRSRREEDDEDDDDDEEEEEEEDEDSRRSRFKSERTKVSQNISLTTTKPNRNIPDSLDDIIHGNYEEPRRSPYNNNKGSVWSRLHRPNPHQRDLDPRNARFRMNGPSDGIGFPMNNENSPRPLMSMNMSPVPPPRLGWQSSFNEDFTSDYGFENFANPHPGSLDKSDLRHSIGTGGDVRSRLGGSVTNNQAGKIVTPQGSTAPPWAQTTASLKRPHSDNATDNIDPAKQMKQDLLSGKNAISLLHEMYKGKINFVEKQIGNVHVPEFECTVEVEGLTFTGVAKQKKAAKKNAAEAAVLGLSQNGVTPVAASQTAKTTTVTPQNGTTIPLEKDITPAGAQTTTPHAVHATESTDLEKQMPHDDNATEFIDPELQMILEIPSGINPISSLHEMFGVKIKFVEKVTGSVHLPYFECSVEVEGHTFKGEGKQKKLAKKKAAEATLLGLMQNWNRGKLPETGTARIVLNQILDTQLKQQQRQGMTPQQVATSIIE